MGLSSRRLLTRFEIFEIPVRPLFDVIEGVEMDLTVRRYDTFDELLGYSSLVASSIGLISIAVFGYQGGEQARRHAADLGVALQLTNILRDLKEDAERGRIYLPLEDLVGVRLFGARADGRAR